MLRLSVLMRAKTLLESVLVHGGIAGLARRARRGRTLVLAYHDIVPDHCAPVGECSLHLPQRAFAAQLDLLRQHCEVVPLDAILGPLPRSARPRVAITFDDAYAGAVTAGVDELRARRLPATIFVSPAFIGGQAFWWDDLVSPPRTTLETAVRERALDEFRGIDAAIRIGLAAVSCDRMPPFARAASEEQLRQVSVTPGITLGSHSWSHPNLSRLAERELVDELTASLQ